MSVLTLLGSKSIRSSHAFAGQTHFLLLDPMEYSDDALAAARSLQTFTVRLSIANTRTVDTDRQSLSVHIQCVLLEFLLII